MQWIDTLGLLSLVAGTVRPFVIFQAVGPPPLEVETGVICSTIPEPFLPAVQIYFLQNLRNSLKIIKGKIIV